MGSGDESVAARWRTCRSPKHDLRLIVGRERLVDRVRLHVEAAARAVEDLEAAVGQADIVSAARGDLRTQVNNLRTQMEAVKAHWEGQGAASFQNVSEAWKVQTQDIVDVLDTFEANLTGTQRQYDADDAAASSNLSKNSSMLGNG